jgi:hypothetical protein
MQVLPTSVSESSLLPTLKARDHQAEGYEAGLRRATPQVGTILKGIVDGDDRVMQLLRSPTASQGQGGALGEAKARKRGNTVGIRDQAMDLAKLQGHKVSRQVDNLIGTPRGTAANSSQKQVKAGAPKGRIEDQVLTTNWGKFEPAIRRWETIIGRQAPHPTKPDGKDGNHRLSSKFTEWMMGLPDGWITDIGLKRNDELKACGNGVVPQQAELALSLLGIKEILER